ncbi:MAG: VIT and VWA domain-containing protein, partial [Pyrinomonadaceae bacterium]
MSRALFLLLVLVCAGATLGQRAGEPATTRGLLIAYDSKGKPQGDCPLKNTSVKTDISGFIARVRVRQEFENPYSEPIEAIYTFPLSQNGAVDDMTMTIGTRVIRGKIMKREEARAIYETAKGEGKAASILDQERPNIFTQSVANIMPGEKIAVEISYVETLTYEDGAYEFVFPMTIGPRYNPSSVTDAAKVAPIYAAGRPGHDISIEINLNAGVPIEEIRSTSHDIQQLNFNPASSKITLRDQATIPNKDFILRYDVTGKRIEDAVLATRDARGGFFTMLLQPPDTFTSENITPKEIVFVLDTSGSMSGFPIEKAKEAMRMSLDGLNPQDTFNLITFAGDTRILFGEPVAPTQANIDRARQFLDDQVGDGGTEMMKAVKAALDPTDATDHIRVVCFMTDGFIGNEDEIIAEIQKHPKARVFSFGIGSSVNRFLLDKMAEAGNGEVEYVSLEDDGSKAAKKFYERVRTPLLTDISIDWNGLPVADVYPSKLPDLFSAKPVIVIGRYSGTATGSIRLKGRVAGKEYSREIAISLPEKESENGAIATLWARNRVATLTMEKLRANNSTSAEQFDKLVADLGLEFRLLTSFTSFVAVEDRIINQNGSPVTVAVPVAVPAGVDPVKSGATVDGTANAAGSSISTEFFSNVPTSRTVQGLYTVAPSAARSGLRSPGNPSSGGGGGGGGGVGSVSGSGSGSGWGSGSAASPASGVSAMVDVTSSAEEQSSETPALIANATVNEVQMASRGGTTVSGSSGPENSFILDGVSNTRSSVKIGRAENRARAFLIVE